MKCRVVKVGKLPAVKIYVKAANPTMLLGACS